MSDNSAPLPLPPTSASDDRPCIYVINSDPGFLELIGELIDDARSSVVLEQMRPNIAVTLDNLRRAQPDLLILDVVPYRRDAEMLLQRMAEDAEFHGLPVLLASTSASIAERLADTYSNFVRDVLIKPFDINDFYARLGRLVVGARVP